MNAPLRPIKPETAQPLPRSDLFRSEVIDENRATWLGPVLIEPTPRARWIGYTVAAIALGFCLLLVFGTASRKVPMTGWIVPEQGLARIVAAQPGVVGTIHVKEGVRVARGSRLITISSEMRTEGDVGARSEVLMRINERRESLQRSRATQESLFDQQARDMNQRLAALQSEVRFLNQEVALQRSRVELSRQMMARETEMRERGLIALPRLQRTKQEELDQSSRLQSLMRNLSGQQRELLTLQNQIQEHPLKRSSQLQLLDRELAGIDQEIIEAETRRGMVVTAPEDGIVTAIFADRGTSVNAGTPLLTVVPENSLLQVHLYSPSRGIGFLKVGQRVLLRVQAFPYQKFGFQEGKVIAISRSASAPAELPPQISGASGASASPEPVYRVTVELRSQSVKAYGEQARLVPGMRVDADVLVERRSLLEWMFEPLFAITGRWV